MGNSNRESFKLLDVSESDSDLETGFVVAPQRKKKLTRRRGGTSSPRFRGDRDTSTSRCRCTPVFAFILGIAFLICWLVTLSWLAAVLRGELVRLDENVRKAVAGSQGVPDALQKCHSMTRELQGNQTELYKRIESLTIQLKNYSDHLTSAQSGLQEVQAQLKGAPELVSIPQAVKDLSTTVAEIGSQIQDLSTTVKELKTQTSDQQQATTLLSANLTSLQMAVKGLMNMSNTQNNGDAAASIQQQTEIKKQLNQLISNVTQINDTLTVQLKFIGEDQKADHKKLGILEEGNQNLTSRLSTIEVLKSQPPTVSPAFGDSIKQMIEHDLITRLKKLEEVQEKLINEVTVLSKSQTSSQEITTPSSTTVFKGSSIDVDVKGPPTPALSNK